MLENMHLSINYACDAKVGVSQSSNHTLRKSVPVSANVEVRVIYTTTVSSGATSETTDTAAQKTKFDVVHQ